MMGRPPAVTWVGVFVSYMIAPSSATVPMRLLTSCSPAARALRTALRTALAAGATIAVSAAAGCRAAVDRAFERPTITFTNAALRGLSPDGGTVDVVARIHNPNPYPLRASRVRYRLLTTDSAEVGAGEATDSLAVGARDSAVLVLPVHVTLAGLVRAGGGVLTAAATTGAAEYRVLGEVVLASTPVGEVKVPLDVRGRAALGPRGGGAGGIGGALGGILGRR